MRPVPIRLAAALALALALPAAVCAAAGDDVLAGSPVLARFGLSPAGTTAATGADALWAEALARSPRVEAAVAAVAAAEARVPQATALPEPRLALTEYLEPVHTRVGPQERALSLSQSVPWFGTLSLRGEVEAGRAEAERAALDGAVLALGDEIRTRWYELAHLDAAVAITRHHRALLRDWETAARARYETGEGAYAEVIKAQVELGLLGDRLASLERRRPSLLSELNARLDRVPDTPVAATLPEAYVPAALEAADLAAGLRARNPGLLYWDRTGAAHAVSARLADKAGLPGLTFGVNWISTSPAPMSGVAESGADAVTATLAVSVPLWRGKYAAGGREAAARTRAAAATRRDLANRLSAELETTLFARDDAARRVALYDTALLPKARQSLAAARAAYETGAAGFLDLVDAERALLDFELSRARALADALIAESGLERLTAAPLAAD